MEERRFFGLYCFKQDWITFVAQFAAFCNIYCLFFLGRAAEKIENEKINDILAIICYYTAIIIFLWLFFLNLPENAIVASIFGIINVVSTIATLYINLVKRNPSKFA